jgi:cell wall-associated NlpC family hydrolase
MHCRPICAWLALVFCLAVLPAARGQEPAQEERDNWGQQNWTENTQSARGTLRTVRDRRQRDAEAQSLTPDERLAILGAALDIRHITNRGSDCSHFVHALYEHAGFPYAYASSTDLYAGIDEFRRVTAPQAGDLVVWRGHAGIVTNPARHSFFSVLSSGPGVDSYESRYWKRRGHPRFFRYVKSNSRGVRSSSLHSPDDF